MEFIFRTLVEMRVDMDDLRREFEAYRRDSSASRIGGAYFDWTGARDVPVRAVEVGAYPPPAAEQGADRRDADTTGSSIDGSTEDVSAGAGEDVVVFRPGMTMEDLEREAIAAALASVGGNRRKAADLLEIGERTLYRKISKYDLDS